MLVLTFRVAEAPFAVAVARVVEVVPRVRLRALPQAPDYLAGLLHFRGKAVPVVDLGTRIAGIPCADRLNTRIILVEAAARGGPASLLGLIAERVDDVRSVDEAGAALPAAGFAAAPYLGAVYQADGGLIQMIEPDRILSDGDGAATAGLAGAGGL
ncbi:chemotaxis protein CheW (plasmid) [Tundrisphaera sp. TA3]|uniref:chemotaxis protein CheW n=1 Tax=Tundrisphaera sp. TA3 TaxID=3435775 RepID=UPI003EBD91AC